MKLYVGMRYRYLPKEPTAREYWGETGTIIGLKPGMCDIRLDNIRHSHVTQEYIEDFIGRIEEVGIEESTMPDTRDYLAAITEGELR